jgi:hypothetical protein
MELLPFVFPVLMRFSVWSKIGFEHCKREDDIRVFP